MAEVYGDITNYISTIRSQISTPALLEQLAEECSELSHAALKKARKLRNENYTPASESDIEANLVEEYTDVYLLAKVCGLEPDWDIEHRKAKRWVNRIQ